MDIQYIKIDKDGDKTYFKDKEMTILHREDGPTYEYSYGYKSWYRDDKRHREDGPAIETIDGYKEWWINGEELTEEEFNNTIILNGIKYKVIENK